MFLTKQAVEQIFFVTIKSTNANSSVLFRVNNYYTTKVRLFVVTNKPSL